MIWSYILCYISPNRCKLPVENDCTVLGLKVRPHARVRDDDVVSVNGNLPVFIITGCCPDRYK